MNGPTEDIAGNEDRAWPGPTASDAAGESRRIDEAIVEYLQAQDEGRPIRDEDWLARHSGIRPHLVRFLAGQGVAAGLVAPPTGREVPVLTERLRYFGDFELVGVLGEGGMGVVYLAHQISLGRPVALKMIRSGQLAGEEEIRRFRNEAEAVARLDHPNLLSIFEVGEHDGRRYFTMPLIVGGSLADHIGRYRDDPTLAARIVVDLAEGIDHAHRRGILHRDLKPANVLIDETDRPLVSDFGLAKRLDLEGCSSSAILGTPAYMAPEQASRRPGAATTACDIYGLGAILFALLTGRPPFPKGPLIEVLHRVCNDPPDDPTRLNRRVDRRLAAVCLRCLEKDPRRRYQSAGGLADDLRRWLRGEPVQARPARPLTRLVLWCRRRPAVAGLALALSASLIGGSIAITASWVEVGRQRDYLAAANARILQERDVALASREFLAADILGHSYDSPGVRQDITVAETLDRGAASIGPRFVGRPALEASLRRLLADSFRALGRLDEAEGQLDVAFRLTNRASAADEPGHLACVHSLAALRLAQGRTVEALGLATQAYEGRKKSLGAEHAEALDSANLLVATRRSAHRPDEALALSETTFASSSRVLGADHPTTLAALGHLAVLAYERGDLAHAAALARRSVEGRLRAMGRDHPDSVFAAINLGAILLAAGDRPGAAGVLRPASDAARRIFGEGHPVTLTSLSNLHATEARGTEALARPATSPEALSRPEPKVSGLTSLVGSIELRSATLRAGRLKASGDVAGARDLMRDVLTRARSAGPVSDPDLRLLLVNLAGFTLEAGDPVEADRLMVEALTICERVARPGDVQLTDARSLRAKILLDLGKFAEAEPLARQVLAARREAAGRGPTWKIPFAEVLLGAALAGRGQAGEAERLLTEGSRALEADGTTPRQLVDEARRWLASVGRPPPPSPGR